MERRLCFLRAPTGKVLSSSINKTTHCTDENGEPSLTSEQQESWGIILTNWTFMEADASHGIHNSKYYSKILDEVEIQLNHFEK